MDLSRKELTAAKNIAKAAAYNWSLVDYEDVESELKLWMLEHPNVIERYRYEEYGTAKLHVTLKREAWKRCIKEQKQALNSGNLNDIFKYSLEQVERTLPYIWDLDNYVQTTVRNDKDAFVMSDYDNVIAILTDISGCYYNLSKDDQKVLELRFKDSKSYNEIGEMLEVSEDGARKATDRALRRLHKITSGNYFFS